MDIFFADPNEIPLPPDEVRIRELRVEPWPDGRKVHVYLEVDPFQKRPNAEIIIQNAQGQEVAQANIIESIERKIEINLHLRQPYLDAAHKVVATLFYATIEDEPSPYEPVERTVVDRASTSFEFTAQSNADS